MTRPVFIYEGDLVPCDLDAGDTVSLEGTEGHHAATVRRIGVGEWIDLMDGHGTRLTCEVLSTSKKGLHLRVDRRVIEPQATPQLILVQGLAKAGRDEQAIEACTEIGIDKVIPWQSEYSIVRWNGPKASKGKAKWESVVRAAAKQARRAWIPSVGDAANSKALATWVEANIEAGGKVFICHEEATESLSSIIASDPTSFTTASSLTLVVGPEGGMKSEEVDWLQDAGASLVGLGANVLRSSTAGVVGATLLSATLGRL